MKTKRTENKLNLKKITITHLNNQEMRIVRGQGSQDVGCPPVSTNNCPKEI